MKAPNLEELIAESEKAHSLTVNPTIWNYLLSRLIVHNVNNFISADWLLQLCEAAIAPPEMNQRGGESIMAHLTALYMKQYGPPKYSAYIDKTYFEWEPLMTLLTELRGDA